MSTPHRPSPHNARIAAALVALAIAVGTLWPMPGAPQPGETACIICGALGGIDFLSNIGLFVPLGVALWWGGAPIRVALALGAGLSLTVEALQWQLIPGRDASMGDLLANSLGAAAGAVLTSWIPRLRRPTRHLSRGLSLAWGGLLVLAGAVGAWALRPAPVDLVYWSQWEPVRGGYTAFDGQLLGLRLFGHPAPNGATIDPTTEDERYATGALEVRARLVPGAPAPGTQLIARAGNPLGEQFEVAQRGDALLFRARRNASRLALRSPTLSLASAFTAPARRPVEVEAVASTNAITLSVRDTTGRVVRRVVPLTLGMAWRTVAPLDIRSPAADAPVTLALFALAFALMGWWGTIGFGARACWGLAVVVAATMLGGFPGIAGIALGGRWEIAGALLGTVLGSRFAPLSAARTSVAAAHRSP